MPNERGGGQRATAPLLGAVWVVLVPYHTRFGLECGKDSDDMAPGSTEDILGQEDFWRLPPSAPSMQRGGREASSHRLTWLTKSADEPNGMKLSSNILSYT